MRINLGSISDEHSINLEHGGTTQGVFPYPGPSV